MGIAYPTMTFGVQGGVAPYTITQVAGGVPPGMTLSPDWVLSGTPTIGGSYSFDLEVKDAIGDFGRFVYFLTIQDIAPAELTDAYAGASYMSRLFPTGYSTACIVTLVSGTLPPGISFFSIPAPSPYQPNSYFLEGTPSQPGIFTFTAEARDPGGLPVDRTYSLRVSQPRLTITMRHDGTFNPGQMGATYSVGIGNSGGGATTGPVVMSELLPAGLTLVSMSGTGWNCSGTSCTRGDVLNAYAGYPPITVTVNVASDAPTPQVNAVSVSGGGSPSASTTDETRIALPQLSIIKSHTGDFALGQTKATYTAVVSNWAGPTTGMVTVTETLPAGLALVSMAGSGWTCPASGNTCTRSDALATGSNFPPITITVNVKANATSPQVNSVTVSGGGSPSSSAYDSTVINANPPILSIAKTHSGNFTQGQSNAVYTVVVSNQAGAGPTSGMTVTVTENVPAGLTLVSMVGTGWTCTPGDTTCTRSDVLSGGSSYPPITVTVNVSGNAPSQVTNQVGVSGGGSAGASAGDLTTIGVGTCSYSLNPTNAPVASGAGTGTVSVITSAGCSWTAVSNATSWLSVTSGTSGSGSGTAGYSFAANPNSIPRSGILTVGGQTFTITQAGTVIAGPQALRFVPVTPCRIADTRNPTGPFGGPALAGNSSRDFVVPLSSCGIPASAAAYSLNVTVVPLGPLQYISVWPSGQPQPVVSTLNSFDGRIKANAAIVPAGLNGAFSVFATNPTHVVVDIDGYFVAANGAPNLAFYAVTPCRIADTRNPTGTFGAPSLAAGVPRTFPVPSSSCGIPASAQAYAFNMTVVPTAPVGYLTTWPTGSSQPIVSTLNAPTGTVTSNAAIVPAGVNGAITVFATNATDLIVDINGYFAPPGIGSLDFYTATPCRVLDTRNAAGSLGGPIMGAGQARSFNVPSSTCGIPATAKAYSLNATVLPSASLQYLTLWGSGSIPIVSTLNSFDGSVVANAALVPAGASGEVTAFTTNLSHLLLDINGYFQ
jgi:uncharacterized repeat protein (TIGR01451 family)